MINNVNFIFTVPFENKFPDSGYIYNLSRQAKRTFTPGSSIIKQFILSKQLFLQGYPALVDITVNWVIFLKSKLQEGLL